VLLILIVTKHNSKKLISTSRGEEIYLIFITNKTHASLVDELDIIDLSHLNTDKFYKPSLEEFRLFFNQVSVN